MDKYEKVIKGLECCIKRDPDDKTRCGECPYEGACLNRLKSDALALLKAQEPVKPKREDDRPISPLRCGNCGAYIVVGNGFKAKYCYECGKAVKWDG